MFRAPQIDLYPKDIAWSFAFYRGPGFMETFRTPRDSMPVHVGLALDGFIVEIATVEAASTDHGSRSHLDGRAIRSYCGRVTQTWPLRA